MKTYLYLSEHHSHGNTTQLYATEAEAQARFVADLKAEALSKEAAHNLERAEFNEDGNTPTIGDVYALAKMFYTDMDDLGELKNWFGYTEVEVPVICLAECPDQLSAEVKRDDLEAELTNEPTSTTK